MGSCGQDCSFNIEQFSKAILQEHDNDNTALSQSSSSGRLTNTDKCLRHRLHRQISLRNSPNQCSSSSSSSSSTSSPSSTDKSLEKSFHLHLLPFLSPCHAATHSSLFPQLSSSTKGFSARILFDIVSNISSRKPAQLNLATLILTLTVIILSLNVSHTEARSVGVCRGIPCANGGRLLVSNSIWGNCRCRCPSGFVGPYCQYQAARKRSVDTTTSVENRRLSRSETMERIRQRLLALSERRAPTDETNDVNDESSSDILNDYFDAEHMDTAVESQETRIDSYRSDRPRRSWYPKDYRRRR